MKTQEQLKDFYENLNGEFEGYIQMSNEKLDKILSSKQILPSWEDLYKNKNFIFEACFFDGDRSITIRQINNAFVVIDGKLSNYENKTEEIFIAKSLENNVKFKAKITQIWEEKEDENCENLQVLKPTLLLFSGFIKGDSE